ncbi:E3 SUMO-protein ligase PIAS2 isoform X2 [Cloeon dipterum]|uniref:E3 SUMO-protein ligase PIAS2 isoform X2 n=1 Tax=Cloeon dipterum TaxID=197152 RepID=UPI00321F7D33
MQLRARSYVEYFPADGAEKAVTSRSGGGEEEMADTTDLKSMILSFRVSELQTLLQHAGKNRSGRKCDLQHRALELLKSRNASHYQKKIQELYISIQNSNSLTLNPEPIDQMRHKVGHGQQYPQSGVYNTQQMPSGSRQLSSEGLFQQATSNSAGGPTYSSLNAMLQQSRPIHLGHYGAAAYQTRGGATMMPATAPSPRYPVHPDVRLKRLPFYEQMCELLKPSTLLPSNTSTRMHETSFTFHLTPQQATKIAMSYNAITKGEYSIQVQLRFALLETSTEQEDCFPPGVVVKVNNKPLTLPNPIPSNKPGVEPKRPPRPTNITYLLKLSPTVGNTVTINWAHDYTRNFVAWIGLVQKLSSTDLLNKLKAKGVRPAEFSRGLIKEKLQEDADCEIATTSLRVSLMCPLGKMRMCVPCRPSTCTHLQCFDASLFIQMNERKPTWNCPVCDKPALFDTIVIDGYFQEVLLSPRLPLDCNEIQLTSDGSWTIISAKKEKNTQVLSPKVEPSSSSATAVETLSDEAEVLEEQPPKRKAPAAVIVDLTLSDSDDEPPAKKTAHRIQDCSSSSSSSSEDSPNPRPTSRSSLGCLTPSIITLDSPSPPPAPPSFAAPSSRSVDQFMATPPYLPNYFNPSAMATVSMPILELDSDSSGSHNSRTTSHFQ